MSEQNSFHDIEAQRLSVLPLQEASPNEAHPHNNNHLRVDPEGRDAMATSSPTNHIHQGDDGAVYYDKYEVFP